MLLIRIDVLPHGMGPPKEIAKAVIINLGTGTEKKGNYSCYFWLKQHKVWRACCITSFSRKNKNVWYLLFEALKKILRKDWPKGFKEFIEEAEDSSNAKKNFVNKNTWPKLIERIQKSKER